MAIRPILYSQQAALQILGLMAAIVPFYKALQEDPPELVDLGILASEGLTIFHLSPHLLLMSGTTAFLHRYLYVSQWVSLGHFKEHPICRAQLHHGQVLRSVCQSFWWPKRTCRLFC